MALTTAADFINNRILRHACQLRPGYTASPELQADVLAEWGALLDEWNLNRDMPLTKPEYTYAITGAGYLGNNRDYQIGPAATAGNFIGPRPVKILKANLVLTQTNPHVRIPLTILDWAQYGSIPVLALAPTAYTQALYYEAAFPTGVIHFWEPINGQSLEIWQNGALVAPALLSTTVAGTLAPGYENAIVYGVAHRCQYLCTKEMGPRNPAIGAWALKARQRVQNANAGNLKCRSDFQNGRPGLGSFDPNITYVGEPY